MRIQGYAVVCDEQVCFICDTTSISYLSLRGTFYHGDDCDVSLYKARNLILFSLSPNIHKQER